MNEQIDQIPAAGFGHTGGDIHDSADSRCPTLLLLDVSGSMTGKPLEELQAGLTQYIDEIAADSLAKRRLEIGIVTFGGSVQVVQDFATPDKVLVPTLLATGDTPMGQAIVTGLELLKNRRIELSRQGISQYKPWILLITDGGPTDEGRDIWQEAISRLRDLRSHQAGFFAIGVEGANMDTLKQLCDETQTGDKDARPPMNLLGLRFRDLFKWLTESQLVVSRSQIEEKVSLPPVTWGSM